MHECGHGPMATGGKQYHGQAMREVNRSIAADGDRAVVPAKADYRSENTPDRATVSRSGSARGRGTRIRRPRAGGDDEKATSASRWNQPAMPLWRSNASILGARPRRAWKFSAARKHFAAEAREGAGYREIP